MSVLETTDPRSKEIFEAVLNHKTTTFDVNADHSFHLGNPIPTYLFVDGILKHSPQIVGVSFDKVEKIEESNLNRKLDLSALHHDLMRDIFEINIEKNADLKKPFRILRIQTSGSLEAPTLVIKVATHARATILEETLSLDQANISVAETHVSVGDGAELNHIHLERSEGNSKSQGSTFAQVAKDATYRNYAFHIKGSLNQRNVDLHMNGSGSHGETHALYLLSGQEKSTFNTIIQHYTPDSTSAQLAKGILDGESRGAFTGRIHIHKDAQRVNSTQLNKNLLLSKKAQVYSEPQLEIFADDVKCSHGSTTGQLSPEEIFYFEARGIPHDKARSLLAMGFGMEIVMKVENEMCRSYLKEIIGTELKNKYNLGGSL